MNPATIADRRCAELSAWAGKTGLSTGKGRCPVAIHCRQCDRAIIAYCALPPPCDLGAGGYRDGPTARRRFAAQVGKGAL